MYGWDIAPRAVSAGLWRPVSLQLRPRSRFEWAWLETESIARDLGPQGVHVAYLVIDAVIDVPWARQRFKDAPDDFFIKPAAIAEC